MVGMVGRDQNQQSVPQNCLSAASYPLTDFLVSRNSHASSVGDALSLACGSGEMPSSVLLWTRGGGEDTVFLPRAVGQKGKKPLCKVTSPRGARSSEPLSPSGSLSFSHWVTSSCVCVQPCCGYSGQEPQLDHPFVPE